MRKLRRTTKFFSPWETSISLSKVPFQGKGSFAIIPLDPREASEGLPRGWTQRRSPQRSPPSSTLMTPPTPTTRTLITKKRSMLSKCRFVLLFQSLCSFFFSSLSTFRWRRRNASGSCCARFLLRKLLKTVLLRTAAHDFLPNKRVTPKIFSKTSRGSATALCHLDLLILYLLVITFCLSRQ